MLIQRNKKLVSITVVGYGSLLSERSAKETVPGLKNFRLGTVVGYRRIFNKVGIVFFEKHGAQLGDLNIASCATRYDGETTLICSAFECSETEFTAIYEREHRFRWVDVTFTEKKGQACCGRMCTEYNDDDYRLNKCVTNSNYVRRVGQYYSGAIWRDDILPFPIYLNHCLQAARQQGDEVLENFLATTYLADNVTLIKTYLENKPLNINDTALYTQKR